MSRRLAPEDFGRMRELLYARALLERARERVASDETELSAAWDAHMAELGTRYAIVPGEVLDPRTGDIHESED